MWIVFTIEQCNYCLKLKELLKKMKLPFLERPLKIDERQWFIKLSGKQLVPQLGWTDEEDEKKWLNSINFSEKNKIEHKKWFNKEIKKIEWIGGYSEFINMLENIKKNEKEEWFKNWNLFNKHIKNNINFHKILNK